MKNRNLWEEVYGATLREIMVKRLQECPVFENRAYTENEVVYFFVGQQLNSSLFLE